MLVIPEWRMVIVRLGLHQATDRPITDATYAEFLHLIGDAILATPNGGDMP